MAPIGWVRPHPEGEKEKELEKRQSERGVGVDNSLCQDTEAGIGTSVQQALDIERGLNKKEGDFVFSKADAPKKTPKSPPIKENQPNPSKSSLPKANSQISPYHLASPTTSSYPNLPETITLRLSKPAPISIHPKSKSRKFEPINRNKSPSPSSPYFVEYPDDSPPYSIDPIPLSYENVLSKGIQLMLNLKRGRAEDDSHLGTKRRLLQLTDSDFQFLQLDQYGSNEFQFSPMVEEAGLIKPPAQP
ncbi:hypothetical protein RJT34_03823 [Clitoria ternatea]|uniref:Uncharacterized protein n=1 Tax=Clitoria ternatea TaxID=43366 RepID=A0AAN9KK49_CLITE